MTRAESRDYLVRLVQGPDSIVRGLEGTVKRSEFIVKELEGTVNGSEGLLKRSEGKIKKLLPFITLTS